MRPLCMTPFPNLLPMKYWIMWEGRKFTHLQIGFQDTTRSEFIRKIDIRQLFLQYGAPFSTW